MLRIRNLLLLILCLSFQGCKDEPFKDLDLKLREETDHFKFYCDMALDDNAVNAIKVRLENNYTNLLSKYRISALPKINILIWSDRDKFNAQSDYPGAIGYVTGRQEIRMLRVGTLGATTALHEFVHILTLFVNNDFANRPRWLWESIAVFESGDLVQPKSLPYMVSGNYPTLLELNQALDTNQKVYDVGYTIAEFIVVNWDYETLINLIKSNGNIQGTLNITTQEFELQWYSHVKEEYLM